MLDARTLVGDVNTETGIEIEDSEEADTIGGYICAKMGRIPQTGEVYEEAGKFRAVVLLADSRTIRKLKLTIIREQEGEPDHAE